MPFLAPPRALTTTPLTWRGVTASYDSEEQRHMRAIAAAGGKTPELEFIHLLKAQFDGVLREPD